MNQHTFILNGELAIIINIKKIFRSIRTKVLLIFLVVSIVPLILISAMLISTFSDYYHEDVRTTMYRQANTIALNMDGYFVKGNNDYFDTINAMVEGRALVIDHTGLVVYDTNDISMGKYYAAEQVISGLRGETSFTIVDEDNQAIVIVPIKSENNKEIYGIVMITQSLDQVATAVDQLTSIATTLVVFLVILIIVMSIYISGTITKPFSVFLKYTKGVIDGRIDEKLDLQGNYEIEEIASSFNHMLDRILEIDENRQQFVANVSHELKTPLTGMKVLAESLIGMQGMPEDMYQEFLIDIRNEIDREADIITDLLTLVNLDKNDDALIITTVNMNELVQIILKRLKPLADEKDIEIVYESFRNVVAEVDEVKMSLVISNLIENAIKYNEDKGKITVTLNADHKDMMIKVKDTGIGIPPESTEKIFERFYRVDKTRARDTGGTGLGLSIVHKTVTLHNGTITCESEIDKGTTFKAYIPLNFIKM